MNNIYFSSTKHLYIHVPFCHYICTYCDFKRTLINKNNYQNCINHLVTQINLISQKLKTIYIGGGTPNALDDKMLQFLLFSLQKNIDKDTEFTIEINPDSLTLNQAIIFKNNYINRVSIGVQTTNDNINAMLNRKHGIKEVINAINILKSQGIYNLSLDFIYNLPFLTIKDLKTAIDFSQKYEINHLSFYALELKSNSIMTKSKKIKLNEVIAEDQLLFIEQALKQAGYERYEVSNWTKNQKYSQHNIAYWLSNEWMGVGYGAHGFENNILYNIEGNIDTWKISFNPLSEKDYYFQILMMGLRLTKGINLKIKKYNDAYKYFQHKLNNNKNIEIKNNYLYCKNIDILDDILINLL